MVVDPDCRLFSSMFGGQQASSSRLAIRLLSSDPLLPKSWIIRCLCHLFRMPAGDVGYTRPCHRPEQLVQPALEEPSRRICPGNTVCGPGILSHNIAFA